MSDQQSARKIISVAVIGAGGMVGTPIGRWFQDEQGYVRGQDLFLFDTNEALGFDDDFNEADLIFIAVPTPMLGDGGCDVSIVESVLGKIADPVDGKRGKMVAIKSTVPPTTTWRLQREHPGKLLLFNPEFLTERQAYADFIRPSRQLIGVTDRSLSVAIDLLNLLPAAPFCRPFKGTYDPRLIVNSTEVELAKYISNLFGALKVAFFNIMADVAWMLNEMADLGDGPTVDFEQVTAMVAADQRITGSWTDVEHGSYSGFGGPCFPKDWAGFMDWLRSDIQHLRNAVVQQPKGAKTEYLLSMLGLLESDLKLLRRIWDNNLERLRLQNLTIEEVSGRDRELIKAKRKPLRRVG